MVHLIPTEGIKRGYKRKIKDLIIESNNRGFLKFLFLPEQIKLKLNIASIFFNKKMKYAKDGYYFLDPMPSKEELDDYYEKNYWINRANNNNSEYKSKPIIYRDIQHFILIKKLIDDFFITPKRILNFGAGHGGISHLFWSINCDVVNIEPSEFKFNYDRRWKNYKDISEVKDEKKFDLIYSSHSLEHVQDINYFYSLLPKILKKGGYFFCEVPNGQNPENGGCNGMVSPPHTYYFRKKFFSSNKFFKKIYCELLIHKDNLDIKNEKTNNENEANIIRYLGKLI